VIGGLLAATIATLFFVPAVFSLLHSKDNRQEREAQEGASTWEI
jgi:Cu/Ag efflux pump CusA